VKHPQKLLIKGVESFLFLSYPISMRRNKQQLKNILYQLDGRSYKAYMDIKGEFDFEKFMVLIDHVQGDPFARPSRIRVRINQSIAQFPADTFHNPSRSTALCDFLARCFFQAAKKNSKGNRGTGHSGIIRIENPGQEILERSSVLVNNNFVEVRFVMGLPAFGRRIAGQHAVAMFLDELPRIVHHSLVYNNLNKNELYKHIETSEDADYLREKLETLRIVSFIADDAILPRASGIDPRPLTTGNVIPFQSPAGYQVEAELPNKGTIKGMGIPQGITLIVGGGYHGKSTLLRAIEGGIYNHIPGDGREFVVTNPDAVKIRAMDGRNIEKVNISPFINNLPFGTDTKAFSTENASGSTSQAANIIEAVEIGAGLLLIDEDTSATNFMIRDHRMQELVAKDKEPITPFIDKARQLFEELKVSTILVIGGSGDYFSVADHVVGMKDYLPLDMTQTAHEIAEKYKTERKHEGGDSFGSITERIPVKESFDPSRGRKMVKIAAKGLHTISFGTYTINISDLEQLVDMGQTRAIGDAIYYCCKYMDEQRTLKQITEKTLVDIQEKGFEILDRIPSGEYVVFRTFELAGAINRLRSIQMNQK
jgi:predicted ABC-class ATPase